MNIRVGNTLYEQNSKGEWLIKGHSIALKKDGKLKAKYKDMPRYDLIPKQEQFFTNEFDKQLGKLQKEIDIYLKSKLT